MECGPSRLSSVCALPCPVLPQWDVGTASKAGKVQQPHISPSALLPQRSEHPWG